VDRVFEQLFIEHYPRLVRTLLRLAGDPGRAEELAAEAFYRLYQRSPDRTAVMEAWGGGVERGMVRARAAVRAAEFSAWVVA
jgi:DNA-directed RNA polymerase specialized sigma24 family protein